MWSDETRDAVRKALLETPVIVRCGDRAGWRWAAMDEAHEILTCVERVVELADVRHIELMRVQPGDTIVISVAEPIDEKQQHSMTERARDLFPQCGVILLDNRATLAVVRPGGE